MSAAATRAALADQLGLSERAIRGHLKGHYSLVHWMSVESATTRAGSHPSEIYPDGEFGELDTVRAWARDVERLERNLAKTLERVARLDRQYALTMRLDSRLRSLKREDKAAFDRLTSLCEQRDAQQLLHEFGDLLRN